MSPAAKTAPPIRTGFAAGAPTETTERNKTTTRKTRIEFHEEVLA